jgi:hypothetical protein
MSDLAQLVKSTLDAEAERAPDAPQWSPSYSLARSAGSAGNGGHRSRSIWLYATGIAAVAASVIGVLVVAGRDPAPVDAPATAADPNPPVDEPAPVVESLPAVWAPPGEEFPLEDLGPVESVGGDAVALAELTRQIGVVDHPPLTVYSSIGYVGEQSLVEWRCLSSGGGAGCSPVGFAGPDLSVTSSIDNRAAEFDLWTWSNVPNDSAYVVYGDGPDARWQAPVSGVAAFPNVDWFDSVAVAYDSAGVEVGRVDPSIVAASQDQYIDSQPLAADLEREQATEVVEVMNTAAMSCLTDAGATFGTGTVGRLGDGDADLDPDSVWAACVAAASSAVDEWMQANEIRFFDPTSESPEADEPFIDYGS